MKRATLLLLIFLLILMSCSKKYSPADPSPLTVYSPTLTRTAVFTMTQTAAITITSSITSPATFTATVYLTPTVTPTLGCQNSGRISSHITQLLFPAYITIASQYCYSPDGKIIGEEFSVTGQGNFHADTTYTVDGLLETSVSNIAGGYGKHLVYDGTRKLAELYEVDSTPNTFTRYSFSYDINNRINRIDQYNNGIAASYRLVTRDASGYITREDYYEMSAAQFGYVTYTRNDTAKEVMVEFYYYGYKAFTLVVDYDASGFWLGAVCTAHMSPDVIYYTESNTLQSGLFDAGGMNGYYYNDKDLYPLWMFKGDTTDSFYPGP